MRLYLYYLYNLDNFLTFWFLVAFSVGDRKVLLEKRASSSLSLRHQLEGMN